MKYQAELNTIQGWTSGPELDWLFDRAAEMDSVVEIGTWKGRASHALLSGCKGIVYCIDHFLGSVTEREYSHKEATEKNLAIEFLENVGHFPNLRLVRMDSAEAASMFIDKTVDMVFIDGGHDYATIKADLASWIPKCRKLICGHDPEQEGVPKALKEFFPGGVTKPLDNIWAVNL